MSFRQRTRSRDTSTPSSAIPVCYVVHSVRTWVSSSSSLSSSRRWCTGRPVCHADIVVTGIRDWIFPKVTVSDRYLPSRSYLARTRLCKLGKLRRRVIKAGGQEATRLTPFSTGEEDPSRRRRNGGKLDHGHVRGLLGSRGTAPGGLRRGTTPATARRRLLYPASGGKALSFSIFYGKSCLVACFATREIWRFKRRESVE